MSYMHVQFLAIKGYTCIVYIREEYVYARKTFPVPC